MNKFKKIVKSLLVMSVLILLVACGQDVVNEGETGGATDDVVNGDTEDILIGLSVVDLTLERWQHDRDIFIDTAEEHGAEVIVQSADGDAETQLSQIQNMLSQNVDVLVIIAANSDALAPAVEEAKAQGVIVVAHDRLINDADVDAYVSFDNVGVGEMQAEYLVERIPEGSYFLMGGEPSDHTAHMFREGHMNVLQPYIDSGDITIVGDQWAEAYSGDIAMSMIENALTSANNEIDAILTPNDSTAGGAVEALIGQDLAGEVLVTGQDADLSAVQRIADGTQSMTVYKPIRDIATASAEVAIALANGEEIEASDTIDNNYKEVPFIKLTPVSVNQDNLLEEIVEGGFHAYEDVYRNVPEDERPSQP